MSNELAVQDQNPFSIVGNYNNKNINEGAVRVEQTRSAAEVHSMIVAAKQFPRDEATAYASLMRACQRKELAEVSMYSYPRAGQTVSGPSIRLAEEAARCWGNVEFGVKELSQKDGESEMLAFAWDLETNVRSSQTFNVKHVRDTRSGARKLTDQRDIYENNANNAGRRLRARILAILPPDFINAALEECARTLKGDNSVPLEDKIKKMIVAFEKVGVKQSLIEGRLGKKSELMTDDELVEYRGIYASIKDKHSKVSDWFDVKDSTEKADELNAILGGKK